MTKKDKKNGRMVHLEKPPEGAWPQGEEFFTKLSRSEKKESYKKKFSERKEGYRKELCKKEETFKEEVSERKGFKKGLSESFKRELADKVVCIRQEVSEKERLSVAESSSWRKLGSSKRRSGFRRITRLQKRSIRSTQLQMD